MTKMMRLIQKGLFLESLMPNPLKRLMGYMYLQLLHGDLAGYEWLIKTCEEEGVMKLQGDLIEVGSFVGGGTRKLSNYAKRFGKKVYAVDIFNSSADLTTCEKGVSMADIYVECSQRLGLTIFEAYWFNVGKCSNVITVRKDSKNIRFSPGRRFCFGFIDGNHSPEYVANDFYLVWNHLVHGGIVAFHDYGHDLPQVTKTINKLIEKHKNDVEKVVANPINHTIFIKKNRVLPTF